MKDVLELKLVELYPLIFRDYGGDMRKTCMHWGMSCGDGWYSLLDALCQTLESITEGKDIQVVADQVKEKFGGLRFYYHVEYKRDIFDRIRSRFSTFMCRHKWGIQYNKMVDFKKKYFKSTIEKISDAVSYAEGQSYRTCEKCGGPGETRGGGWVSTLCEECDKEGKQLK